jgi:undecaprenyl-diphosphatase
MSVIDAFLLGILQGVTEFLPISSSGHLVLAESLMNLKVEDLVVFDIAVHFGTLVAIFVYFRQDIWLLIRSFFNFFARESNKELEEGKKMVSYLIIGTLPVVAVGLFASDFLEENFRNVESVAVMLMLVAVYFVASEYAGKKLKAGNKLSWIKALFIGLAQSVALIPGVSRSGSTIATGIISGMDRQAAARFSFLLGSVAITAATLLSVYKIYKGDFSLPPADIMVTGILAAGFSGYLSIHFLLKFLRKHSLNIFAIYLASLAIVILLFA